MRGAGWRAISAGRLSDPEWTVPGNRQSSDMVSDKRRCKLSMEGIVPALILSEDTMGLLALVPLATQSSIERRQMAWMIPNGKGHATVSGKSEREICSRSHGCQTLADHNRSIPLATIHPPEAMLLGTEGIEMTASTCVYEDFNQRPLLS